jgi:hypothetical protein
MMPGTCRTAETERTATTGKAATSVCGKGVAYALIAMIAFGLALRTKIHPLLILIGGVALGWVIGVVTGSPMP